MKNNLKKLEEIDDEQKLKNFESSLIFEEIQCKFLYIIKNLTFEQLQQINNNEIFESFKHIVEQKLRKTEDLDPLKVVAEFSKLSIPKQDKILKEILLWSDRKIKEHREDFGYNINGIILRYIKDNYLVRDLKQVIDFENSKWLTEIWSNCVKNNKKYIFTEKILEHLEEHPQIKINDQNIKFLKEICSGKNIKDIVESIRLLATLIEDDYINCKNIFIEFITHDHPSVRAAAVEAIWQIDDKSYIPYLQKLLKVEISEHVIKTLEYVINILEKNEKDTFTSL